MKCILCYREDLGWIVSKNLWPGKNPSSEYLKMIKKYQIVQCNTCDHIQIDPLPNPKEDLEFYQKDTHTKEMFDGNMMRGKLERDTQRRANLISGYLKPPQSILDFGCGFGVLIGELVKRGFDSTGVDVSNSRLELARVWNDGEFKLFNPDSDFNQQFNQQYDAVCAFHVLEHLRDPILSLYEFYSLVKPGGYLILEVPNAGDSMLENLPAYNQFFWQRIHISYFDVSRLKLALKRAGCPTPKIQFTQRYGIENLFHWVEHAAPEWEDPSFETNHSALKRVEEIFKRDREETGTADTLIAIVEKPRN